MDNNFMIFIRTKMLKSTFPWKYLVNDLKYTLEKKRIAMVLRILTKEIKLIKNFLN